MSKDIRTLLFAVLASFLVLFMTEIVMYRDIVDEIRVGDGHVASDIGQHNDMVTKH